MLPEIPPFKLGLFSLEFDGVVVVGDLETDNIYVQNAAASAIWTLFQAGFTVGEAVAVLSESFKLREQEALAHIRTILGEWQRLGLLGSSANSCAKNSSSTIASTIFATSEVTDTFAIGGLAFSIRTDNPDISAHIFAVLRSLRATEVAPNHSLSATRTADGRSIALFVDGEEHLLVEDSAEMIGAIFQTILELIRGDGTWLALIHGAAVAFGDVGILLSAKSGSGKSTLAAYLSANGFDYLSDDMIALDKTGEIVPWPVPHSLKRGSWKTLEHLYPQLADAQIERIQGREMKFIAAPSKSWGIRGVDTRLLIFPCYSSDRATVVERITPLLALQRLIEDRIWLGNPIAQSAVKAFLEKLETTPAYVLQYNNLQEAEKSIRRLIATLL